MMKLIDTDVVIDHFHGHQATLLFFANTLTSGEILAISVVTLTELLSGMRDGEEKRTEQLFSLFTILPINEEIGRAAGNYLRQFRKSHRLELGDALIAGTAAFHGAEVITRNLNHYPMSDIQVIAPYQRGA
jgi:predicted nucleic acid-binding protein